MGPASKLEDEAGRLAALKRYEILDTASEDEFEQIIQLVQRVFGVPMAAVTLIDGERQWFKAQRGLDVTETPRNIAFCHHTITAADGLAVEDAHLDARFAGTPLVAGEPHIRSYLGAPLQTPDGYHVGALCIIGRDVRRFSQEDREILRRFSEIVVSQMELRQLASRDSLTDTLTRRAFEQEAFDTVALFRKRGIRHAVAILDIDHFKLTNDAHGHGVGDDVLRALAAAIKPLLGPFDAMGRLGGEEFGVLLEAGDQAAATVAAERLRQAVADMAIPGHPDIHITISMGVAVLDTGVESVEEWMRIADAALYDAKRGGRNRVCVGKAPQVANA